MRKFIINADDCGKTFQVDEAIRKAINEGIISSTTIMANMDDFDGAVSLYKDYHDVISFGWHINLTEGKPLTTSQLLLDQCFYTEVDGKVLFNGKAFWHSYLNKAMSIEITKELVAQYEKLRDYGIEISHVDSHHHIHTAPSLFFLMPAFFKKSGIKRCRRIKNYGVSTLSFLPRQLWAIPFKLHGIRMPDTFASFKTYYDNPTLRQGKIIEFECHPGHPKEYYNNEMDLIHSSSFFHNQESKLITYKEL